MKAPVCGALRSALPLLGLFVASAAAGITNVTGQAVSKVSGPQEEQGVLDYVFSFIAGAAYAGDALKMLLWYVAGAFAVGILLFLLWFKPGRKGWRRARVSAARPPDVSDGAARLRQMADLRMREYELTRSQQGDRDTENELASAMVERVSGHPPRRSWRRPSRAAEVMREGQGPRPEIPAVFAVRQRTSWGRAILVVFSLAVAFATILAFVLALLTRW